MKSVLILDDDEAQLKYLSNILKDDFIVHTVNNPLKAHKMCSERQFNAIIVDVHMPIINGFEFIKSLKSNLKYEAALFILSSDSSPLTKLLALDLGIKDFLWPDMLKDELILRIKNHIKTTVEENVENTRTYKYLHIDFHNFQASLQGKKLDLTLTEFKILSCLMNSAGNVVDRDVLKEFIWPQTQVLDKTLNTHLTNLRSKLANSNIEIKSLKNKGILLV